MKPVNSGINTIDAICNALCCIDYPETIQHHELCNPKERCSQCILRSAICKAELGKGVKKFVLVPEINHNLDIFLGQNFCSECFQQFENEEEKLVHKLHDKKQLS